MSLAQTIVSFGEWLPDAAELGNGSLVVANNVIADVDGYRPYRPLMNFNATLPATARGLFSVFDSSGIYRYYAGTDTQLYMTAPNAFTLRSGTLASTAVFDWSFAQYENLVFACNTDNTMYHTIGAATNFATSAAPKAGVVAVVGQFVVVGDLRQAYTDGPARIQWCSIDQPLNWPTPGSSTAIASQAGSQLLNQAFGSVQQIIGGDQNAVILQETGITRMTYVGPPAVFQFDEIERSRGAAYRMGAVKAGAFTHFYSYDGFYATDGVSVAPTGFGKVDKTFNAVSSGNLARCVFNQSAGTVYWSFATVGTALSNKVYAFHIETKRWTSADDAIRVVDQSHSAAVYGPYAFGLTNNLQSWNSTAGAIGTALLSTGDVELNTAGRAFVGGVKPHVESTATAPSVTVRIGSRNDLATTPAYTATTTPTTRTGFADCRVDAKYHRAEVQIVGNFRKASGLEFKAGPTGSA